MAITPASIMSPERIQLQIYPKLASGTCCTESREVGLVGLRLALGTLKFEGGAGVTSRDMAFGPGRIEKGSSKVFTTFKFTSA